MKKAHNFFHWNYNNLFGYEPEGYHDYTSGRGKGAFAHISVVCPMGIR